MIKFIAGPCVFENLEHSLFMAKHLRDIFNLASCDLGYDVDFTYKMSFDKANRTSRNSYRGGGFDDAWYAFNDIKGMGIKTTTDIHEAWQAEVANVDVLQIPAFLCRQTDLIEAAVKTGKTVSIKKGQFLSPGEMEQVIKKAESFGGKDLIIIERGTTFGYNNLVVDMRVFPLLKKNQKHPVYIDCTHAVQSPGGQGDKSGGNRELAPYIAKAAVAAGADGVFMEVHQDPDDAPSDGPNMINLENVYGLVTKLCKIRSASL